MLAAISRLAAIVVAVPLIIAAAPPASARCQPPPDTTVTVTVNTYAAATAYDNRRGRAEIAGIGGMSAANRRNGQQTLGLTVSTADVNFEPEGGFTRNRDGSHCLWIRGVTVTLRIPSIIVYVAREYRPGSCQYKAVLAHEEEHVRRTKGLLTPFAADLHRRVHAEVSRLNPIQGRSAGEARKRFGSELQRFLNAFVRDFERARDHTNALIDTPQSYQFTSSLCPRW